MVILKFPSLFVKLFPTVFEPFFTLMTVFAFALPEIVRTLVVTGETIGLEIFLIARSMEFRFDSIWPMFPAVSSVTNRTL